MAKFVFDKCCFCIDLRVGCFVIGYINLVLTSILAVLFLITAVGAAGLTSSSDPDIQTVATALLAISIVTLIVITVFLIFVILLLAGLHKNKPGYVKAYLIYNVIFLVLQIILFIVTLSSGPVVGSDIASTIVSILFNLYMLMVIRSYYYVMTEPSASPHV